MTRRMLAVMAALLVTTVAAEAGDGSGCSADAQSCLNHLAANLAQRGWVGVELERSEAGPMTVLKVVDDSPAARAGLLVGDVLVGVNGFRFGEATQEEIAEATSGMAPGTRLRYRIERDGRERTVNVTLGEMPDRVRYQIVGQHMLQHAEVAHAEPAAYERADHGHDGHDHDDHGHEGHGHADARGAIGELSVARVARLVRSGDAVAVDANRPEVRRRFGIVPSARLLTSSASYDVRAELPADKDTHLIFYCANTRCTASDVAARRAVEAGYTNVHVMRAGIMGWQEAGQRTAEAPRS